MTLAFTKKQRSYYEVEDYIIIGLLVVTAPVWLPLYCLGVIAVSVGHILMTCLECGCVLAWVDGRCVHDCDWCANDD